MAATGLWMLDSSSSSSSSTSPMPQSRPSPTMVARTYGGLLLPLPEQLRGMAATDTQPAFFHSHMAPPLFKHQVAVSHGGYFGSSATHHHGMAMEGGCFMRGSANGGEGFFGHVPTPMLESAMAAQEQDQQTLMGSSGNNPPKNNSGNTEATTTTTTTLSNNESNITDNNKKKDNINTISLVNRSSSNVAAVYWEGAQQQQQQYMSRNVMHGEWDLEELMKEVSSLPFLDFQVE
uniref:Uncharacterized protein n=1 Tax=Arundo donax TaxID=35708 RepID=A0A0A9DIW2_ARUDO